MRPDIVSALYFFDLGLIQRENELYSLVDLKTGDWYEKMTIYYIENLLRKWNHKRKLINC
ncbi:MAG: hypothetical protein LUG12_00190 [Erysipelotrichaceae bacterium]|nr:hypothetical protein [Erysipelotrichaceae bacterium]